MKKLFFFNIIVLILTLIGCTNDTIFYNNGIDNTKQDMKMPLSINDYFAYKENTKYIYEGNGNEYASYYILVDFLLDNYAQIRINNGGTEIVKVIKNEDGMLNEIISDGECYFREDFTKTLSNNNVVLLKEPLIKGASWEVNNKRKSISNVDIDIKIPLGTYKAMEITTEDKNNKTIDYYAPAIGLIKSVYISNGEEITSTLSKIESNAVFSRAVKFYYPSVEENKIYFLNKNLTFKTNDITENKFEEAYKDIPNDKLNRVLGTNAKINSLNLKDKVVYIDFSKEFVSEMNAGSGYEGMILQCITNTLGSYYGVNEVCFTIQGSPYLSGHFMFKNGETLKTDNKNCFELK